MGTPIDQTDSSKLAGAAQAESSAQATEAGPQHLAAQPPDSASSAAREPEARRDAGGVPEQADFWRQLRLKVLLWRAIALVFMGLGFAGVVLPVMPHVPFFLVALWAAGKGWPELERWLLRHPTFGPQLTNWKERKAISRPVKIVTSLMMLGSAISMQFVGDLPIWLRVGAPCFMLIGIVFMWTRPDA